MQKILSISTDWACKSAPKRAKTCVQCARTPTELPFCLPPLVVGFKEMWPNCANFAQVCFMLALPFTVCTQMYVRSEKVFFWKRPRFATWLRGTVDCKPACTSTHIEWEFSCVNWQKYDVPPADVNINRCRRWDLERKGIVYFRETRSCLLSASPRGSWEVIHTPCHFISFCLLL